ncbi:MAG: hypothetical protein OXU63_16695 [Acidobacteriota bacterium]|nr:hypothetical protein [Acidobacteriota bacterium]
MNQGPTVDQGTSNEIVRRIVEVAEPDKIILFGSAARGETGPRQQGVLLEHLQLSRSVVRWVEERL